MLVGFPAIKLLARLSHLDGSIKNPSHQDCQDTNPKHATITMFVRQSKPLLYRAASRYGPVALNAGGAAISSAASVYRLQSYTCANHLNECNLVPSASTSQVSARMIHTLKETYDHILVEKRTPENSTNGGGVGLITLHRPKALNALCDALFEDLIHAVNSFEDDEDVGCVVVTGSPKAFAAGE